MKRVQTAVKQRDVSRDVQGGRDTRTTRHREGGWRARNKKKIEWKHLRNCANYVGAGVLDAVIKRSHGGGGGEFVLIAMNTEREINQVLNVYDLARERALRDELQYDGN